MQELNWAFLLYLIFMPLVYKGLYLLLVAAYSSIKNKGLLFWIGQVINIIVYYFIECIFLKSFYKVTGEWLIYKNLQYIKEEIIWFIVLSIVFIVVHIAATVCWVESTDSECFFPYFHLFILGVCFYLYLSIGCISAEESYNKAQFEAIEYQLSSENKIDLYALSDTHITTGDISGGHYYISGTISDNYEIYYSYLEEDGSIVIDHFTYDKNNCTIYPEKNCENPRIIFRVYSKSYADLSSSYTKVELHIPANNIGGIEMNME